MPLGLGDGKGIMVNTGPGPFFSSCSYLQEKMAEMCMHPRSIAKVKKKNGPDMFDLVIFSWFCGFPRESHVSGRNCSFPEVNRG